MTPTVSQVVSESGSRSYELPASSGISTLLLVNQEDSAVVSVILTSALALLGDLYSIAARHEVT